MSLKTLKSPAELNGSAEMDECDLQLYAQSLNKLLGQNIDKQSFIKLFCLFCYFSAELENK